MAGGQISLVTVGQTGYPHTPEQTEFHAQQSLSFKDDWQGYRCSYSSSGNLCCLCYMLTAVRQTHQQYCYCNEQLIASQWRETPSEKVHIFHQRGETMPCHCFGGGGNMKTCIYKVFMLLVGKKSGSCWLQRAFPSFIPPSRLLGWNPGPHTYVARSLLPSVSQQLVFTVFLITVAPEWTW